MFQTPAMKGLFISHLYSLCYREHSCGLFPNPLPPIQSFENLLKSNEIWYKFSPSSIYNP